MQTTISETATYNPIFVETPVKEKFIGEPRHFRWTKKEYHKMAELGMFKGKRTEFLEGEIIEMPAMNSPHATGLTLTDEVLREIFPKDFVIRNQMPLNFGDEFETVPDIGIAKGKARDYLKEHPKTADLVIEISDITLSYDRNRKASLYAKFGIQDYWVLNLKKRTLEVYRQPSDDENAYYDFSYEEKLTFGEAEEVSPLAMPQAKIKISDLLP